jgi:hypothetical protein
MSPRALADCVTPWQPAPDPSLNDILQLTILLSASVVIFAVRAGILQAFADDEACTNLQQACRDKNFLV